MSDFTDFWFSCLFPWCDSCKKPAIFSETFGMLHASKDFRYGVPPHLDPADHEVTMQEWWNQ